MRRVIKQDREINGMHRDKIVLLASILFYTAALAAVIIYLYLDNKIKYFPIEELKAYEPPVVFLESEEGEVYFISLDNPEDKHTLDKDFLFYDYNPVEKTFLYSNRDGMIYEYDLSENKSRCLIEKDSVCSYLNLPQDSRFGLVDYYFDRGKISFVCGEYLLIYDVDKEEFIYNVSCIPEERTIQGWLTPQTLITSDRKEAILVEEKKYFEYNVYTGEKTEIPGQLGTNVSLSWDKSMGCSIWEVYDIGLSWPIRIWDTQNYEVKQLVQGIINGSAYLSSNNKYVMLERNWNREEKLNEVWCIKLEDESMCEVYTTEDRIRKIIW